MEILEQIVRLYQSNQDNQDNQDNQSNQSKQEKSSKTTNELVKQIHNEFRTINKFNRDYKQSVLNQYKSKNTSPTEEILMLERNGLVNNPKVIQHYNDIQKEKINLSNADALLKEISISITYSNLYPDYKFITLKEVLTIAKKYDLVLAEIKRYKGDVPCKNLLEIESFIETTKLDRFTAFCTDGFETDITNTFRHSMEQQNRYQKDYVFEDNYSLDFMITHCNHEIISEYSSRPLMGGHVPQWYKKSNLEIVCPQKDLILRTDEYIKDNRIETLKYYERFDSKGNVVSIPDPIVLYRVEEGYLIITAWGEESEDELLK